MFPKISNFSDDQEDPLEIFNKKNKKNDLIEDKVKIKKNKKFRRNKRATTLFLCKKGININHRHYMNELSRFLPNVQHAKKFTSIQYINLNPLAEGYNCENILFLETKNEFEPLLWISKVPEGPSVCFLIQNFHSVTDNHFNGICTHKSSPLLIFDPKLDITPEHSICKELIQQSFKVPFGTKGMKHVFDTALTFFLSDGRIWIRRYQILPDEKVTLIEAGPRLCLYPLFILSGSFCGKKIWKNNNSKKK